MRIYARIGFVVALFLPSSVLASDLALPAEVYGSYAPAGDCSRSPRINVDKAGVHLDTPAGKRSPLPIMVSYTWFGGASYSGIQTWALVKYGGKDRWGDDNMPLLLTFNADEKRGVLSVNRNDPKAVLDGPLTSIAQTGLFKICRAGATAAAPTSAAAPAASMPAGRAAATPVAAAQTPAARFAAVIGALMQPATAPANSYYDWRFIEQAPNVTWAPLPPEMLDKPLVDGHYFRRNGIVALGGQSLKIMAAGARTTVFNHYFKNEGRPLGEPTLLAALRASGLTVTPARCGLNKSLQAPTWYRLSGNGKRTALLWVAQPRGAASPWEGFNLSLDASLKPMTAQERMVYTDRCA